MKETPIMEESENYSVDMSEEENNKERGQRA